MFECHFIHTMPTGLCSERAHCPTNLVFLPWDTCRHPYRGRNLPLASTLTNNHWLYSMLSRFSCKNKWPPSLFYQKHSLTIPLIFLLLFIYFFKNSVWRVFFLFLSQLYSSSQSWLCCPLISYMYVHVQILLSLKLKNNYFHWHYVTIISEWLWFFSWVNRLPSFTWLQLCWDSSVTWYQFHHGAVTCAPQASPQADPLPLAPEEKTRLPLLMRCPRL